MKNKFIKILDRDMNIESVYHLSVSDTRLPKWTKKKISSGWRRGKFYSTKPTFSLIFPQYLDKFDYILVFNLNFFYIWYEIRVLKLGSEADKIGKCIQRDAHLPLHLSVSVQISIKNKNCFYINIFHLLAIIIFTYISNWPAEKTKTILQDCSYLFSINVNNIVEATWQGRLNTYVKDERNTFGVCIY